MELFLCQNMSRREDAYLLLSSAVKRRWDLETLPVIARGKQGKPYFPQFPQYHFNLSHSGQFALCALDERPVGVDIECIRPHHFRLADRICSPEELDWLARQPDKTVALCQLWTCKEALVKYHGTGLTVPLRTIRIPLSPASEQDDLLFHSMVTTEFCLCVCGHSAPSPLILVDRDEFSH